MDQQQPPGIVSIGTPNMQAGGVAPGVTAAPLVMPVRIARIDLPGIYTGFWVKSRMQVDPTIQTRAQAMVTGLRDPDEPGLDEAEKVRRTAEAEAVKAQAARLLSEIITDHNLVDFEGEPLPPTTDFGFWQFIGSGELQTIIMRERDAQMGRLDPTKRAR